MPLLVQPLLGSPPAATHFESTGSLLTAELGEGDDCVFSGAGANTTHDSKLKKILADHPDVVKQFGGGFMACLSEDRHALRLSAVPLPKSTRIPARFCFQEGPMPVSALNISDLTSRASVPIVMFWALRSPTRSICGWSVRVGVGGARHNTGGAHTVLLQCLGSQDFLPLEV